MDCPRCGNPLEKNQESCSICKWGAREPIRDLSRHIETLDERERAATEQARLDNLKKILAETDAHDVEAQGKLGMLIHIKGLLLQTLYANVELLEGNANPERRDALIKTVEEWNENYPALKKRWDPLNSWLKQWDEARHTKKEAKAIIPPPVSRKHAKKRPIRDEKIWEIIQTGVEGIEYCKAMRDREIKGLRIWVNFPGYVKGYSDPKWRKKITAEKDRITRRMKQK